MGDLSSLLQNLFGGGNSGTTGTVPTTPGMTGTSIAADAAPNSFNTPTVSGVLGTGMSGLQLGQLGLGLGSGLLNGYLGFQNLGLAKSQAKQAQNNWDKQWSANVKNTNAALADRQAARVASNPNAYESVDSYMKKYGIS